MTEKQTLPKVKEKNIPRKIAYFSMEIVAGDTIKSFADLKVPAVAVTLLYKKGLFYQKLDNEGIMKGARKNCPLNGILRSI